MRAGRRDRRTRPCASPAAGPERASLGLPDNARMGLPRLSPIICLMPCAVAIAALGLAVAIPVSTAVLCLLSGMIGGPALVVTSYLLIEQNWLESP